MASISVSIVAILQSKKSIKMTEDKIRAENRPYVSFYVIHSKKNPLHRFFVIKNFGVTSAKIKSITFDKELDELNSKFNFSSLVGSAIAPGQEFTSYINQDYKETVTVSLSYSDSSTKREETYSETFIVKTDMASSLLWIDEKTIEKAIDKSSDKLIKATNKSTNKIIEALNQSLK